MKKALITGIVFVCILLMYKFPHTMINAGELVDAHQKLNDKCLACHEPFWGVSNNKCISCHKLSEIGKGSTKQKIENIQKEKILFHQNLSNQKCTFCHTDHKGIKPTIAISNFTHEILTETQKTKCNSCHVQPTDKMHKQLSSDCKSCHNTNGWKSMVAFNHDLIQNNGKINCTSCHQTPNDSFHKQVNDNCDKCHSSVKWVPSTFDHSAYFELDGEHNVKCNTCHITNNFKTYTCYGCHKHSESKIRKEHLEHGITNFTNCSGCHKSGNEHDIRTDGKYNQKLNSTEINTMKNYLDTKKKDKEHKEKKENEDD